MAEDVQETQDASGEGGGRGRTATATALGAVGGFAIAGPPGAAIGSAAGYLVERAVSDRDSKSSDSDD